MRILVLGGGGREHAIVWKLAQSPREPQIFVAPGNPGTRHMALSVDMVINDVESVLQFVLGHDIDLTIVGPEAPLQAGVADLLRAHGRAVLGANRAAARIEWSKAFAKQAMADAGVPTAAFRVFDGASEARAYVREHGAPVVVKADGLAAGKGVVVASTVDEALRAVDDMMIARVFGDAGESVVIEDCLQGPEVSVFCFTDGRTVTPLVAACDVKRVLDGDAGPNTGGMGGYSPPPFWTPTLEREVRERCVEPVVRHLAKAGTPYQGVLYCGLMLTAAGPHVIEFNARFGDPETQLILPRLENDLVDVVEAVATGHVEALSLRWSDAVTVGVVMASGGYPAGYHTGMPVAGLDAVPSGVIAFHAGTAERDDAIVTGGGRVLAMVGVAPTHAEARRLAYEGAAAVSFDGAHYRRDIAAFADY